jgi:sulfocyanin
MNKTILMVAVLGLGSASAASYVSNNAGTKTATLTVEVAANSPIGALNFNGAAQGSKSFTVPAGWNVVVNFKNMGSLPHSAVLVKGSTPPASVTEKDAAFPGAASKMVMQGLAMNAAQTLKFKASTAGSYLLICGVPGHALGGQYLGFKVVAGAKAASYN